jgi:hypothetical protein
MLGIGSLLLMLAGCSDVRLPEPAPEPEIVEEAAPAPEPEVVEEAPEPEPEEEVSEVELEACRVAWWSEVKAVEDGVLDDATLRATGTACPNLEVWEQIRDEVGYGSKSPNLATAICALEEAARICGDN